MAKNHVEITAGGDSSKAVSEMQKIVRGQERAIASLQKTARASKKAAKDSKGISTSFDKAMSSATGLLGVLGAGVGIAGAIQTIIGLVEKWDSHVDKIAGKLQRAQREMVAFALLQEGGTKAERVRAAAYLGAKYNVSMGDSWSVVQSMQSLPGYDFDKGMKAAESVFQGKEAGMDVDALTDMVAAVVQKGLPAWMGVYLPFVSGQASHKKPETMTKAAKALPYWKDPTMAMAFSVPILGTYGPDEFQTYLLNAGSALNTETGDLGKLWKKLGVTGKAAREKLQALADAGLTTPEALGKEGVVDKRTAGGLAAAANGIQQALALYAEFESNAARTYVPGMRAEAESEIPSMKYGALIDRLKAEAEVRATLSDEAQRAQLRRLKDMEIFTEAQKEGRDWLLDDVSDEKGLGWWKRGVGERAYPETQTAYLRRLYKTGVIEEQEKEALFYRLRKDLRDQTGAEWDYNPRAGAIDMGGFYYKKKPGTEQYIRVEIPNEQIDRLITALEKATASKQQALDFPSSTALERHTEALNRNTAAREKEAERPRQQEPQPVTSMNGGLE